MPKGINRPRTRHILPNGMWVCIYDDGTVKISGYHIRLELTGLQNWGGSDGGADVYLRRVKVNDEARKPVTQKGDWVSVPAEMFNMFADGYFKWCQAELDRELREAQDGVKG